MKKIRRALARLGVMIDDLLFPENVLCLCCDCALGEGDEDGVCKSCRFALESLGRQQEEREAREKAACLDGIEYVHAAYVYEGQVRKLIHRLKYESVRAAAVPLAKRMAYLSSGEEEIIVPVPTDKQRERRRGFNQSALLSAYIGKELGMRAENALWRVEHRRPQTGLSERQRRENLIGCMAAGDAVKGRRVLLVDDVYTTGATVCEAARALKAAGATSVAVFTAARALADVDEQEDPFVLTRQGEKREKP